MAFWDLICAKVLRCLESWNAFESVESVLSDVIQFFRYFSFHSGPKKSHEHHEGEMQADSPRPHKVGDLQAPKIAWLTTGFGLRMFTVDITENMI
jgi:hypothetical protein